MRRAPCPLSSMPVRSNEKMSCIAMESFVHAGDFGNGNDLACAVRKAGDLDDRVNGGRNLMADRALGNIQVRHRNHIFDTSHGVARRVGVDRGQRSFVARVHGLQHVEGFFATHLANHDAVGTHTQTVDDQLPLANRALAFDVGRTRFQTDDVFLLELQFGRVFDGDDALGVRNVSGQHVQQSRFSGAGSAGDENVEPALDHGRKQFQHRLGQGLVLDHLARSDGLASETANGETGTIERERRNDGVDTRSVSEAGIHHRRRFVHATAHPRDDALDDLHQVDVVFEGQCRQFELAGFFDVDPVVAVDQDVGDVGILEQLLERPKSEDLVENFARKSFAFGKAERHDFAVDGAANDDQHFVASGVT